MRSMSTLPQTPGSGKEDAARISLEIAKIASSNPSRTVLAEQLAGLLLRELGAGAVAFFWIHRAPRSTKPPKERAELRTLTVAQGQTSVAPIEDDMKAAAGRAWREAEPRAESIPPETMEIAETPALTGRLLSLPVGNSPPWAIVTAWWPLDAPHGGQPLPSEELLRELQPSLTVATMPAHLVDGSHREIMPESENRRALAVTSFISMISHELRTPLNAINGFLEVVLDGQVGPLNPRQEEFLGYVRSSALQLTTLVEDILFITKADTGQFALRPAQVEVNYLLHQAIQSVSHAAERAKINIGTRVPGDVSTIWGDELRLRQVITNLLNNAIKFSPPGADVTITLSRRSPFVEFAIADNGQGIALADQQHIFERFYQSESNQTSGGYGLGLAIAKMIIEQHGGRIWLSSIPGNGATFYFTLPLELA